MKVKIGKYKRDDSRNVDIQIDKFDTWSLDHSLALIILPALLQLKATGHGIPGNLAEVGGEDYNEQLSFDFYRETSNELFETVAVKRWEEMLDKMIWSFQQLVLDNWDDKYRHGADVEYDYIKASPWVNPITNQTEDTYKIEIKNPDDHWTDYEGMRVHKERMQEGFELFGKYFLNLWD